MQIAPWNDPLKYVPTNPVLKCGEELAEDGPDDDDDDDDDECRGPINFHLTLPGHCTPLLFNCRHKSSGTLLPDEPQVAQDLFADAEHSCTARLFFEPGFSLEAMTGFQVWPGNRLLIEALTCRTSRAGGALEAWRDRLARGGLHVLEMGAGAGAVGCALAAAGATVLVTDLQVLVEHGVRPNLRRNGTPPAADDPDDPAFLRVPEATCAPTRIGRGWAGAAALDWFQPVAAQLPRRATSRVDVVVGCDCLCWRRLVDPFLEAVAAVFEHAQARRPRLLFTYQRRTALGLFIGLEELLARCEARGWTVECVAWRSVDLGEEGKQDLYLLEATPGRRPAAGET